MTTIINVSSTAVDLAKRAEALLGLVVIGTNFAESAK